MPKNINKRICLINQKNPQDAVDKIVIAMKISQVKEVLNSIFEEDESLKYALATNLAKYGRPQSKKSDKPAKLTKGLEKGREKYVKDLKKAGLDEDKGRDMAREFISKMRDAMRSLSDDELDTFRKDIAQAFDLNMNEAFSGFIRNPEDPDSEPFTPTGSVSQFQEDLKALFGKFKSDLKNPEFIRGVAEIMVNWKLLLRSQLDEDEGTLNKIADMLSRKFDDLRFDVNTMADRIDVRGSQQDLFNFGTELHGEKIFDYEVWHTDDDDRGEIVRIVKSDSIMREDKKKADRCLRIARRKIPQSSAYRSGLIVKCRKGMIWKSEK